MTQQHMQHLASANATILQRIHDTNVHVCRWTGTPKPSRDTEAVLDAVCDAYWFPHASAKDLEPVDADDEALRLLLNADDDIAKVFAAYAKKLVSRAKATVQLQLATTKVVSKQRELTEIATRLNDLTQQQIEAAAYHLTSVLAPAFAVMAAKARQLETETGQKHPIVLYFMNFTNANRHVDYTYLNATYAYRRPSTVFYRDSQIVTRADAGNTCIFKGTAAGKDQEILHSGIDMATQRKYRGVSFAMFLSPAPGLYPGL